MALTSRGTWFMRVVLSFVLWGMLATLAADPLPRPSDPCPAPAGSAEVNLHAGGDKLYLSWLRKAEQRYALQVSVLANQKWSDASTVVEGEQVFANWADFPSVVELADGSCVAHWLWRSGSGHYAYDVMVAKSTDTTTWDTPLRPHHDGTQTEHGFVSLVTEKPTGFSLVWLDGRAFAGKEAGDSSAEMHLMWTRSSNTGLETETLLDARVCDCCQTAAVATRGGVLVAHRDRSADEVRDIFLVRRDSSGWTKPYPLAKDDWRIPGCPVNGPARDAIEDRVVAAWFTMRGKQPVVQPSGGALVVWMETTNTGEASILARRVGERSMDPWFLVAGASAKRSSGFPRVARCRDTLYFAWTDDGEPSQVRLAALEMPRAWR